MYTNIFHQGVTYFSKRKSRKGRESKREKDMKKRLARDCYYCCVASSSPHHLRSPGFSPPVTFYLLIKPFFLESWLTKGAIGPYFWGVPNFLGPSNQTRTFQNYSTGTDTFDTSILCNILACDIGTNMIKIIVKKGKDPSILLFSVQNMFPIDFLMSQTLHIILGNDKLDKIIQD